MLPSEFIPRVASKLEVSRNIRRRALELAERAESNSIVTGVQPSGFAGACLYKSAQEIGSSLTQGEIAEAVNASTATIRSHRDALEKM
jgi:transcription initiation factor TFIIB